MLSQGPAVRIAPRLDGRRELAVALREQAGTLKVRARPTSQPSGRSRSHAVPSPIC